MNLKVLPFLALGVFHSHLPAQDDDGAPRADLGYTGALSGEVTYNGSSPRS